MKDLTLDEKITVLLIEGFSEFATEGKVRPFGSDRSDITKKYHKKFKNLLKQEREEIREKLRKEIFYLDDCVKKGDFIYLLDKYLKDKRRGE